MWERNAGRSSRNSRPATERLNRDREGCPAQTCRLWRGRSAITTPASRTSLANAVAPEYRKASRGCTSRTTVRAATGRRAGIGMDQRYGRRPASRAQGWRSTPRHSITPCEVREDDGSSAGICTPPQVTPVRLTYNGTRYGVDTGCLADPLGADQFRGVYRGQPIPQSSGRLLLS
jgi:hypothetical protein